MESVLKDLHHKSCGLKVYKVKVEVHKGGGGGGAKENITKHACSFSYNN